MNENIISYLMSDPSLALWIKLLDASVVAKAICALANTNGGSIVVGIDDDMNVVGIDNHDINGFLDKLNSLISPLPPFSISQASVKDKQVLLVNVLEGNRKPYSTCDCFYLHRGDTIYRASMPEVTTMTNKTFSHNMGWERQVVSGLEESDLSPDVLKRFGDILVEQHRLKSNEDYGSIVRSLGFKKGDNITNAGAVMLCETPSIFLPQCRIRVSVFGPQNALVGVRLYDSNLPNCIDAIVDYVHSLYPRRVIINGLQRIEQETLPIVALREGLLNACVHRIYDSIDSYVSINAYEDRLEIVNSGKLLGGLTPENLEEGHPSILRNPDIANAFFTLKYIEMSGTGIRRIITQCEKNGCQKPIWKIADNTISLIFPGVRHSQNIENEDKMVDLHMLSSDSSVRESLIRIMEFMQTHENVKLSDISELLGKSYPTVKRYMRILTDSLLVEYRGNNRSGGWFLASHN